MFKNGLNNPRLNHWHFEAIITFRLCNCKLNSKKHSQFQLIIKLFVYKLPKLV